MSKKDTPKHTTDLYFEAHVTIDPVETSQDMWVLNGAARYFGFRVAELLYKKTRDVARVDDFMTGRDKNYDHMYERTTELVTALKDLGFVVRRYKIENTLLDVRLGAN